jgi:hypothetical protein
MPKFLEDKLKAEAEKKDFKGKRADRYVYGAMNNIGAMRGNQETAKGAAMDAKHRRDEEIKKYKGQSASFSTHRPVRKVLRRTV